MTMVALVPSEAERTEVRALVDRRFRGYTIGESLIIGTAPELAEHFSVMQARGVERFYVWFADFAPTYSPDGTSIAFISDRRHPDLCCNDLFVANADGTHMRRIPTGLAMVAIGAVLVGLTIALGG